MLRRIFTRSLALQVGSRTVTFSTLTDFEFSLSSRTEVPASKVAQLVGLPPDELEREAHRIRQVERHFVDVLARSLQGPGSIGGLLRELDPKLFSQDHEWRAIVAGVNKQDEGFDDFKKLALIKYMQYLSSRQEVLKSLYSNKTLFERGGGQKTEADSDSGPAADSALRETSIFDMRPSDGVADVPDAEQRLPKGETVSILLPAVGEVDVLLSRHRFKLVAGDPICFVDGRGMTCYLRAGQNVVGRDVKNEIVVNAAYRDVSRKHVIMEPTGVGAVRLTDLSSHGTFVPAGLPVQRIDDAGT